jgi:aryl-alcohol dehydrogenase-like predicted oxidoreductase
MSLTDFRTLGRSGLVVSPQALGTMTFGTGRWGTDEKASRAIFDAYRSEGGNFVDTADVYSGGESESMVGRFLAETRSRDEIVLATKFGFNASRGNPNAGGTGAKNVHRALDQSLKRLQTDRIDLFWLHVWDGVTPVEEIVQTLAQLVQAGKVLYYGLSDVPAWFAMKAATIAAERRLVAPVALQVEYSLVAREVENEHFPVAREAGMSVVPWSPLAGGFLTGKYLPGETSGKGRLSGPNPLGDSKFTEGNWNILAEVQAVAQEMGCSASEVALAWVGARPGVAATLLGASSVEQLKHNVAACGLKLRPEHKERLNRVSAPLISFGAALTQPGIRQMVFGGNTVQGWGENTF